METNEIMNNEEAIQALSRFANACYTRGRRDALIGVGVGAVLAFVGCVGGWLYAEWEEQRELKKSINNSCTFVEEES